MKKIVFFKLSGKFAHFKFPFTSPNYLKKSFSIPPKTTILGMLGSMMGLKGFHQYESQEPEYYSKLKHIPITICLKQIPLKILVVYNSINSFAKNIPKNPIVNIKEEVLLNPSYKIGLLLDDTIEIDRMILEKFVVKQISSVYPLYLGKNEFFANIVDIRIFNEGQFTIEEKDSIEYLNSIIPIELLDKSIAYKNIVYDSFSKDIIFNDKKLKTILCEVAYFVDEEDETNIKLLNPKSLLRVGNKYYYIFKNGR